MGSAGCNFAGTYKGVSNYFEDVDRIISLQRCDSERGLNRGMWVEVETGVCKISGMKPDPAGQVCVFGGIDKVRTWLFPEQDSAVSRAKHDLCLPLEEEAKPLILWHAAR